MSSFFASSSDVAWGAGHILPEVNDILNWSPPLSKYRDASHSIAASNLAGSFCGSHLLDNLVLKRVVYLSSLVDSLAGTVDRAIREADERNIQLTSNKGTLKPLESIKCNPCLKSTDRVSCADTYASSTAAYCLPIASTLFLHPSSPEWTSLISWTAHGGGSLKINDEWNRTMTQADFARNRKIWNCVEKEKKTLLNAVQMRYPNLGVWEMDFSSEVMEEIVRMGRASCLFEWKKCGGNCAQRCGEIDSGIIFVDDAPGFDTIAPPWALTKPASAHTRSNQHSGHAGAELVTSAQFSLQQVWTQAVLTKNTFIVLHSPTHSLIGIRHRATQTLYISDLIQHSQLRHGTGTTKNTQPAYGRIQVGLYISILRDAMDRTGQELAMERERNDINEMGNSEEIESRTPNKLKRAAPMRSGDADGCKPAKVVRWGGSDPVVGS